jgi:hypothetical protein
MALLLPFSLFVWCSRRTHNEDFWTKYYSSHVLTGATQTRKFVYSAKRRADGSWVSRHFAIVKLQRTSKDLAHTHKHWEATEKFCNSMELSPTWEAANSVATQELPIILRNPKVQHSVHKSPALVPIPSQINPVHTTPFYLLKIHFIIILPPTSRSS